MININSQSGYTGYSIKKFICYIIYASIFFTLHYTYIFIYVYYNISSHIVH